MTLAELASSYDVGKSTISRLKNGPPCPKMAILGGYKP
jgi:hypothetical protein